jgi:hypothetical protein
LPPDGRPLALALAIDELVGASWPELTRADAPLEKPELPEVERPIAPEPAAPVPSAPRVEIGAGVSGETYGRGSDYLGGDIFAIFWVVPQLGFDARAGLRAVSTVPVDGAAVRSDAVVIAIGPTVRLMTLRDRLGLDFAEQLDFVHLRFTGEAKWPLVGADGAATAIYAKSRLRGWVAMPAGLRLVAEAGVGASLRSVQVVVGDVVVAGADGMQLSATLGVAGAF